MRNSTKKLGEKPGHEDFVAAIGAYPREELNTKIPRPLLQLTCAHKLGLLILSMAGFRTSLTLNMAPVSGDETKAIACKLQKAPVGVQAAPAALPGTAAPAFPPMPPPLNSPSQLAATQPAGSIGDQTHTSPQSALRGPCSLVVEGNIRCGYQPDYSSSRSVLK